jgi:hypothetical protein
VRKQYNFWPGERGFDAWDVDRLIEMAADLPVIEVPIGAITEIDSTYWYGHGSVPTVRSVVEHARLMAEADTGWPILLSHDGRVMDGMHRVERALLEGAQTIRAVQFIEAIAPDYVNCLPEDLPHE